MLLGQLSYGDSYIFKELPVHSCMYSSSVILAAPCSFIISKVDFNALPLRSVGKETQCPVPTRDDGAPY